jgi:two-component system C4-dicarboxylate transport sensor histidine kinase DctB
VRTSDETVSILVRDFGPGVPTTDIDKVFEAFFTTKQAGVGMGLGLSISYNIIEDFGGTLAVDNHTDGGAVFRVDLQRVAAPMQKEIAL